MANGLLMIENAREAQVLKVAFEQLGTNVVISKADYKNYTLSLQYQPDFLLMELPCAFHEQMHIVGLLRKHPRFRWIPIVGYGNTLDRGIVGKVVKAGVSVYIERPLTFMLLLDQIEKLLNPLKKTLKAKFERKEKRERDFAAILDPRTPPAVKIDTMVRYVSKLMAFPFTCAKVLQITGNESSEVGHLAQAIATDPVITASILKISNSVFFSRDMRRIHSIREAIVRIGFRETKRIVMSMSVLTMFTADTKNPGFNRLDFWYHSLAAGLIAERMAKLMTGVNLEIAFLAGLLHDIGIIIIDEHFPDFFSAALQETSARSGHFPVQEVALFGMNHNELIARLFPSWKIPDSITDAIVKQANLADNGAVIDTIEKKTALCVMLGNMLAKVAFFGKECDQYVWPLENRLLEQARVTNPVSDQFFTDVQQDIERNCKFLGLDSRDYSVEMKSRNDAKDIHIGIANIADHVFVPIEFYLRRKGFTVDYLRIAAKSDTAREHDADNEESSGKTSVQEFPDETGCYHLVIVWLGAEPASKESIAPYTIFEKYRKKTEAQSTEPKKAPVLCMAPPDFSGADLLPAEISIISNHFDLRDLDLVIEKIVTGNVVRCLSVPAKPATDVPEPQKTEEAAPAAGKK